MRTSFAYSDVHESRIGGDIICSERRLHSTLGRFDSGAILFSSCVYFATNWREKVIRPGIVHDGRFVNETVASYVILCDRMLWDV